MFDRIKRIFSDLSPEGRERAYLNDSANLYDLELRHREIDRGKFRTRPRPF